VVGSAPTLLTTHLGWKCSAAAVSSVIAVKAGIVYSTTTWAPFDCSFASCGARLVLVGTYFSLSTTLDEGICESRPVTPPWPKSSS